MVRHCFQKTATPSNQIFTFTPSCPPSEVLISSEMAQMRMAGGRGREGRGLESCPLTRGAPRSPDLNIGRVVPVLPRLAAGSEPGGGMWGRNLGTVAARVSEVQRSRALHKSYRLSGERSSVSNSLYLTIPLLFLWAVALCGKYLCNI